VEKMTVGIGIVSLVIRHARSLKDRRQTVQSLIQRLKNSGFSASEINDGENYKRATIGFSICSGGAGFVEAEIEKAKRIFIGDFEIAHAKTEMIEIDSGFELPLFERDE